jgi:hypothetical protein
MVFGKWFIFFKMFFSFIILCFSVGLCNHLIRYSVKYLRLFSLYSIYYTALILVKLGNDPIICVICSI